MHVPHNLSASMGVKRWWIRKGNNGTRVFRYSKSILDLHIQKCKNTRTRPDLLPLVSVSPRTQLCSYMLALLSLWVWPKLALACVRLQNLQPKPAIAQQWNEGSLKHSRECHLPAMCPHNAKATKKALRDWLCLYDLANLADSGSLALPEASLALCMASGK